MNSWMTPAGRLWLGCGGWSSAYRPPALRGQGHSHVHLPDVAQLSLLDQLFDGQDRLVEPVVMVLDDPPAARLGQGPQLPELGVVGATGFSTTTSPAFSDRSPARVRVRRRQDVDHVRPCLPQHLPRIGEGVLRRNARRRIWPVKGKGRTPPRERSAGPRRGSGGICDLPVPITAARRGGWGVDSGWFFTAMASPLRTTTNGGISQEFLRK